MGCDCDKEVNVEVNGCEINLLNKPFLNTPSVNDLIYIFDKTDNTCKATSLEKVSALLNGLVSSASLYTGSDIIPSAVTATVTDTLAFNGGIVGINTTDFSNDPSNNPIKLAIGDGDFRHTFADNRYFIKDSVNNIEAIFGLGTSSIPYKLVVGTRTSHNLQFITGNGVRMGIETNGHIFVNKSSNVGSQFNITSGSDTSATSILALRNLSDTPVLFARSDNRVGFGLDTPSEMVHVLEKVRADLGFNVNGVDGLGAIGGTTYTFGGGGSGDIATMTFNAGILTATTLVP